MTDGAATLRDALNRLDGDGLAPSHVALREPTLDDVFLTLTGSNAGSNAAPATPNPAPNPAPNADPAAPNGDAR